MIKKTKSFTLIEILIVIAIIGILAGILILTLSKPQEDARNAIRVADLDQAKKALISYHYSNTLPFPVPANEEHICALSNCEELENVVSLSSIEDPLFDSNSDYAYIYKTNEDGTNFSLGAMIEEEDGTNTCYVTSFTQENLLADWCANSGTPIILDSTDPISGDPSSPSTNLTPTDFLILMGGEPTQVENEGFVASIDIPFQVPENYTVILDGSDSRGNVFYNWICEADGVEINVANSNHSTAYFISPFVGQDTEITCTLEIEDVFDPTQKTSASGVILLKNGPVASANYSVSGDEDSYFEEGEEIFLGSNSTGSGLSFLWECDPLVTLDNFESRIASFAIPEIDQDEVVSCTLTIEDMQGETASDTIEINLTNGPVSVSQGNVVGEEGEILSLSGKDSIGNITSYIWNCDTIPVTNTKEPEVLMPEVLNSTNYECTLTAHDYYGKQDSSSFFIQVQTSLPPGCAEDHTCPPQVYLSPERSVLEGDEVTLSASILNQQDVGDLNYLWSCILDSSPFNLSDNTLVNPTFIAPQTIETIEEQRKYIDCFVEVTDELEQTSTSTIQRIYINNSPNVNLNYAIIEGDGDEIAEEGEIVELNTEGSAIQTPATYTWECDSPLITLSDSHIANSNFTIPKLEQDLDLTCTLTVSDYTNELGTASILVLIKNGPKAVTSDITITNDCYYGVYEPRLSGSNSIGSDLIYSWNCDTSDDLFTVSDLNIANPILSTGGSIDPIQRECVLTVEDSEGKTDSATAIVTVDECTNCRYGNIRFPLGEVIVREAAEVTMPVSYCPSMDTYNWTCTHNGSNVPLSDPNIANPVITIPSVTVDERNSLNCSVETTRGETNTYQGSFTFDQILNSPLAKASSSVSQVEENSEVTLSSAGSIVANPIYSWTCDNGVTIDNPNQANPTLTTPFVEQDTYVTCILTLIDYEGVEDTAQTSFTILNGPVADVSGSLNINENSTGVLSFDPPSIGDLVGYTLSCENNAWILDLDSQNTASTAITTYNVGQDENITCTIEVEDSQGNTDSKNFNVKVLNSSQVFDLELLQTGEVLLRWEKAPGTTHTYIERSLDNPPLVRNTGEEIYFGTEEQVLDSGIVANQTYCYSAWGYDSRLETYSENKAEACILVEVKIENVNISFENNRAYFKVEINTLGDNADLALKYKKKEDDSFIQVPSKTNITSGEYSFELDNLSLGDVDYEYEITLSNGLDTKTRVGEFQTNPIYPTISNVQVTNIDTNSAKLSFDLEDGGAVSDIDITYDTNLTFTNNPQVTHMYAKSSSSISGNLENLVKNTTYYYKIEADNVYGNALPIQGMFTTEDLTLLFADRTVAANEEVTLSATVLPASDDYTYLWSCPGLNLSDVSDSNPTFIAPDVEDESYGCTIVVSDGENEIEENNVVHVLRNTALTISCTGEVNCEEYIPVYDGSEVYNHLKITGPGEGTAIFSRETTIDLFLVGGGGGANYGGAGGGYTKTYKSSGVDWNSDGYIKDGNAIIVSGEDVWNVRVGKGGESDLSFPLANGESTFFSKGEIIYLANGGEGGKNWGNAGGSGGGSMDNHTRVGGDGGVDGSNGLKTITGGSTISLGQGHTTRAFAEETGFIYSGGGGGGTAFGSRGGYGGINGGGDGTTGYPSAPRGANGISDTGGGGGGSYGGGGGNGGSGIIIIRWEK